MESAAKELAFAVEAAGDLPGKMMRLQVIKRPWPT